MGGSECDVLVIGWSGTVTFPVAGFDPETGPVDETLDLVFGATDRPEVGEMLRQLGEADVLVMIATENIPEAQELLATRYLDTGLAGALVNSALVGTRSSDPDFYGLCLEVADVQAERVLFVDCSAERVAAASEAGLQTILLDPHDEVDVAAGFALMRAKFLR